MVFMTMMDCYQGTPEKGGEVADKGGTPEMEVAAIDICVSVCSSLKNKKGCQKNSPHK
jgi:hypothetical protein